MYSASEIKPLLKYLTNHKYNNLHTRKTKQVNKKRVLKHLHGMMLKNSKTISGHFCGQLKKGTIGIHEIEYEIDNTGTILVKTIIGLTKVEALNYIDSEIKAVMIRVTVLPMNFAPKYLKNNFYLRRHNSAAITPAANKAVANGVLSSIFVNNMASWNINVIEGHK